MKKLLKLTKDRGKQLMVEELPAEAEHVRTLVGYMESNEEGYLI